MKKVFLLLLSLLVFLIISCKGTPKPQDEQTDTSQNIEISEDSSEDLSDEDLSAVDLSTDIEEESQVDEEIPQEISDADSEDSDIDNKPQEIAEGDETDSIAEETGQEDQSSPGAELVAIEQPPPVRQPPLPPPALLGPAEEKPKPPEEKPVVREPSVAQSEPPKTETPQSESSQSDIFREPPLVSAVRDTPLPPLAGIPSPQDGEIIYSRVVRCTVGQIVEIPFRGTGWVFLGELASRRGIVYDSRRLDPDGQTFLFRVEEAGTYSLKFYKQDFIRDYILNDYVQVIAGEAPNAGGSGWFNPPFDRGRVTAEPRWPSALEEAEIRRRSSSGTRPPAAQPPVYTPSAGESAASERTSPDRQPSASSQGSVPSPQTVAEPPATAAGSQPVTDEMPADNAVSGAQETLPKLPPEEILQKAQESFDDGNVAAAIALLDRFREYYPAGSDELYWLYGQFYEANTPCRDILLALDYYRRLINEYPQSRRYNDARRRIAYLERFYINIQ